MKYLILPFALFAFSGVAQAHPHEDQQEETNRWPYFGLSEKVDDISGDNAKSLDADSFSARLEQRLEGHWSSIDRSVEKAKLKNKFLQEDREIESLEDMRGAAQAVEELLADSGLISSLADMVIDLAEDFDVETDDNGIALNFEGKRLGRLKVDKDHQESFDLEALGRNLTIDKKRVQRNGKTKTRIVIEIDGDEAFDVDISPRPDDP